MRPEAGCCAQAAVGDALLDPFALTVVGIGGGLCRIVDGILPRDQAVQHVVPQLLAVAGEHVARRIVAGSG